MIMQYKLSNVTKDYLSTFYRILDKMIEKMTSAELSGSISYNFIVQMIPHHRAAIEMSENLLKYTTFVPLQDIAEQIIYEQTKSIDDMLKIKDSCDELKSSKQDLCLFQTKMNQIMQVMFKNMRNACTSNSINADFMHEMIPHHKGAVEMSQNTLQYNICPELVPIIDDIIISQKKGIIQMQHLLRCIREN